MERRVGHPRAAPDLWPVLSMAGVLMLQVVLLQVAVNRLSWGLYQGVIGPVGATIGLSLAAWLLYRQVDR